jgi:hypothetical protein
MRRLVQRAEASEHPSAEDIDVSLGKWKEGVR